MNFVTINEKQHICEKKQSCKRVNIVSMLLLCKREDIQVSSFCRKETGKKNQQMLKMAIYKRKDRGER